MSILNFEQEYLGIIIETYEKSLMKSGDPKAYKLLTMKSVGDLKSVSKFSRTAIDSFPGSKYDLKNNRDDATKKKQTKDSKSFSNSLKKGNIPLVPEELNNYIEKCFGCDLRLQWDWQFLPPNDLLDIFDDMFKHILDQLQHLLKLLQGNDKLLQQLCHLPLLFNGIPCPQDILGLILALKLLLNKYLTLGLKLKIDWFSLFGPLITALVNFLTYLVNFIFDLLSAPLGCTLATVGSGLNYARLIEDNIFSTPAVKPTATTTQSEGITESENILGTSFNKNYNTASQVTGPAGTSTSQASTSLGFKSIIPDTSTTKELAVPANVTGGFNIHAFIDNFGIDKPGWADLSVLEQVYVSIVEAKDYLNFYRAKMMEIIYALNGLVKGTKLLDIQTMSALIIISELITLLTLLLTTDLKTICDTKDKSKLNTFVKSYLARTNDSIEVSITTSEDGEAIANITDINGTSTVELKSCSGANTLEDLKKVENILSEIERLTRNG